MNLFFGKYLKLTAVSMVLGFSVMLAITFLIASLISKIPHYENFYKIIAMVLKCIPVFLSTKIVSQYFNRTLILTALFQTIISGVIFLLIALVINGDNFNFFSFSPSLGFMSLSAIISVLIPNKQGRKKQR